MVSLPNVSTLVSIVMLSSIFIQSTLGEITCEQLNKEDCAFAVSSSGKRCVLEKYVKRSGVEAYKCTTSAIEADKLKEIIETNHCIEACGLDRDTLGISSDSLLESRFTRKLCSPQCYNKCPNVIDLYFNLAAGEGVYLPKLCNTQGNNPRRGMLEIMSSGIVAPGPMSGVNLLGGTDVGAPIGSPISSIELLSDAPVESPITYYPSYPPVISPISSIQLSDAPAESPPVVSPATCAPVDSPTTSVAPAFSPYY